MSEVVFFKAIFEEQFAKLVNLITILNIGCVSGNIFFVECVPSEMKPCTCTTVANLINLLLDFRQRHQARHGHGGEQVEPLQRVRLHQELET